MYIYSVEEKNNVESFFKNIAIKETINYGTEQIYVVKKVDANLFETNFQKIIGNYWIIPINYSDQSPLLLVTIIWSKWKTIL